MPETTCRIFSSSVSTNEDSHARPGALARRPAREVGGEAKGGDERHGELVALVRKARAIAVGG